MQNKEYDVVVVGSGAGGGMSSYVLTQAGLKVLMLEAGRDYGPLSENKMFDLPSSAPLRATGMPSKPWGPFRQVEGGYDMPGEPYSVAENSEFRWFRSKMMGGKTHVWGNIVLRFGPYDFKPYSRDGLGVDWPVSYEDIAPWYDKVEKLIGVSGANHGFENSPDSAPGILQPPPPLRAHEYFVKRGFEHMGIPVASMRSSVLTKPLNGRSACFYATPCDRGCSIRANFQSTTVLIPPALETGNLEIRTNAVVYQVDVDKKGKARGVSFIDKITGEHHSVTAKTVVLTASAYESTRLLLNSKSALFPQGIGNEHGQVGRYLMDTPEGNNYAHIPALENMPPRHDDGIDNTHMYVPWWGHQQQARGELDFTRGYHIQVYGGQRMPEMNIGDYSDIPYGDALRTELRRKYGSYVAFHCLGEMIPNDKSYCEIDPQLKDKWGIPVLRFHWHWGEQAEKQAAHMHKTCRELVDHLGGRLLYIGGKSAKHKDDNGITVKGGEGLHEVGGARMGSSPKQSVVNQFGQVWGVNNLFMMDGAVFASNADKNPTLTILALAWRSSAHLIEEARKGNI